jgi:hypothetical protein
MDLTPYGNQLGISDILEYRNCPARFADKMRRHRELPPELQLEEGEKDDPTEATNTNNAYGSAVHEMLALVTKHGYGDDDAVSRAFARYSRWLLPEDIELLREDLATFHRRVQPNGLTLVAAEQDMRVPLFVHDDGQMYFFRFKIDALWRMDTNPGVFIMRDYKSSKWRKSAAEVHSDPQQWAYNFGVHDLFPDCQQLFQIYDQLRFGEERTTKNAAQREQMRRWLIENVKAILADDALKPTANEWCRFCSMVVTCRETKRLTREWRGRLAMMAPLTKKGRTVKAELIEDAMELEGIIANELPQIVQTRKHLEHVEKALKGIIEQMPVEERARLGWRVQQRKDRSIAPEGLRALHEALGERFYELVSLPMARLEEVVGKPKKGDPVPAELQIARDWTVEAIGASMVLPETSK